MLHKTFMFLGTVLICLGSGCAPVQTIIMPGVEVIDLPSLNEEATAELGDTVVTKGKVYSYDGIELRNQVKAGDGIILLRFSIPPQKLAARLEDKKWTYYSAKDATVYDAMLGTKPAVAGLKISKRKPGKIALYGNTLSITRKPSPTPQYKHITIVAVDEPGFRQELIYNGKTGNFVKFLYTELSNDMMRAPFSQEVQYDLSDDNTIGFKGVRIEIVDATNTQLTYRVLNSFPDSP